MRFAFIHKKSGRISIEGGDEYIMANGREVMRDEYPELFALYGTRFGYGNGKTTFVLPTLRVGG